MILNTNYCNFGLLGFVCDEPTLCLDRALGWKKMKGREREGEKINWREIKADNLFVCWNERKRKQIKKIKFIYLKIMEEKWQSFIQIYKSKILSVNHFHYFDS